MKKEKKYRFYYIFGTIMTIFSIIILLIGIFVPMSIEEILANNSIIGWVFFGLVIIGAIGSFFGTYLLKKGNFLKINYDTNKEKDNFINKE